MQASAEATLNQLAEERPSKATLVIMSGDMDKVLAAFIIATGAACKCQSKFEPPCRSEIEPPRVKKITRPFDDLNFV